ncbi:hypothetical protein RRG08_019638 [Elysia crispata]|uniref:Uncharacterized protein n=1 Tax=Elysia crispata TaxID=231223 RepID=A0AAE0ZSR9_9GAST|nr:hypothetical protein RRG08_019638 [Elysia crispata]
MFSVMETQCLRLLEVPKTCSRSDGENERRLYKDEDVVVKAVALRSSSLIYGCESPAGPRRPVLVSPGMSSLQTGNEADARVKTEVADLKLQVER